MPQVAADLSRGPCRLVPAGDQRPLSACVVCCSVVRAAGAGDMGSAVPPESTAQRALARGARPGLVHRRTGQPQLFLLVSIVGGTAPVHGAKGSFTGYFMMSFVLSSFIIEMFPS